MTSTIETMQSFSNVKPADLYELFMASDKHSVATGMPAKINRKVGGKWSAFGGMILGKNLALIPNRMIVQAWRSSAWEKTDPDSVLIVQFEKSKNGATLHLTHIGVPPHDHKGVTQGWTKYYWKPWRKYLKGLKHRA